MNFCYKCFKDREAKRSFSTCQKNLKKSFLKDNCSIMKDKYAPLSLDYEVNFNEDLRNIVQCNYKPSDKLLNAQIAKEAEKINHNIPTVFLFGQTGKISNIKKKIKSFRNSLTKSSDSKPF